MIEETIDEGPPDVVPIESAKAGVLESYPAHRKRSLSRCQHRRFWVDEKVGKVECRDCEERLDPIRALLIVCGWFHYYRSELEQIEEFRKARARQAAPRREVPAALNGRAHLLKTHSTGRYHAALEAHDREAVLACGGNAKTGLVAANEPLQVVLGALRYGMGCSRCLQKLETREEEG